MGSFFAGIKAGTLGGILYVGGMAAFNVILLYTFQSDVLTSISRAYPAVCPMTPNVNGTSVLDCFNSVVAVDVPYTAFVAFFITLVYAGIFGTYHDYLPRLGTMPKGMIVAAVIGTNLLLFGYAGFFFDASFSAATGVFLVAWTAVFGYVLARLYQRYTRRINFESQDSGLLKVLVDGRDVTGRSRTFATTSTHRLRAEVGEGASFKEWETTGGVTLEDSRSFETVMEIGGDGSLRGKVGPKY